MIRSRFLNLVSNARFPRSANLSNAIAVPRESGSELLISCRRKELNLYTSSIYEKLDEIPLASKGWGHSKAKGDYFTVLPCKSYVNDTAYSFEELGIHTDIIDVMRKDGIVKATEFQYRAIQAIESRSHCLLGAETGCGKTIAYLLPIIQALSHERTKEMNSPRAVIILPNRELAYQVGEVANILSQPLNIRVKILVGGRIKRTMMNPTFEDVDILVATPGAIGKLSTVGIYKLNEATFTVLDEADTLLDDSFQERMRSIFNRLSHTQMILVSATIPRKLPDILLPIENQIKYVVSPQIHKPLLNISQKFLRLTMSMKPGQLLQLAKANKNPMIIFSNRNQTSNWVSLFLKENGVDSANINGDMNYAIRIEQWNRFVSGETNILSSTDVGSRGLNTIQVKHVLNYDFPLYAADYIHRIGRVGRLGSITNCKVTNFVAGDQEISLVQQIEMAIRKNQPISNVDGNITNILQKKIARRLRDTA